jgi:tetratricopeptide (TPR) repeat protein
MSQQVIRLRHWIALAALFLVAITAVLLWSTRSLSRHDPKDAHRAVSDIARLSAAEYDAARLRNSLLCLDSLSKAKPRKAIEYCNLALELDPKNVTALNLRGNAHLSLGEDSEAIADFSRAIELSPHDPEAYRFRAHAYAVQNRARLAIADFNRALALAPADPINVELRGHFYQAQRQYAPAIADFTSAIALRPELARAWNSRCWTRVLSNSNYSAALSDCNRAIQLDPANANAYDSRGFVFLRTNRFRSAVASFDEALRRQPKLASSWFGRGMAKLRLRDLTASKDLATAKLIEPAIESRFLSYGIKVPVTGPSGA